jgi:uncharacterized membrane protein YqaE (UPF0057 family)
MSSDPATATSVTTTPGVATGARVGDEATHVKPMTSTTTKETTVARSVPHHAHHVHRRTCCEKFVICLFCFILPPLAVAMEEGCGFNLCLNILFLILGWIPAIIHALCIVTF